MVQLIPVGDVAAPHTPLGMDHPGAYPLAFLPLQTAPGVILIDQTWLIATIVHYDRHDCSELFRPRPI